MIERALEQGVEQIFLPNIDHTSVEGLLGLCEKYPGHCFPMMGLHPCSVKADFEREVKTAEGYLFSESHRFYGVGETGLDYHWDTSFKEQQIEALKIQIEWAKTLDLPLVLHCRESFEDVLKIVSAAQDNRLKGIFHCFTGDLEAANAVRQLGNFQMGIGGVITFKNSALAATVKAIPLESLVLETDAPFLAPVPYRGKRNESSYVVKVAEKIAEAKDETLEAVANTITQNARTLFQAEK